jgi:hypothetical protein
MWPLAYPRRPQAILPHLPFYQISSMASRATFTCPCSGTVSSNLFHTRLIQQNSVSLPVAGIQFRYAYPPHLFWWCFYWPRPKSKFCAQGNYCLLPRILFYITIAAAVLLRSHLPWLYVGALAASLTYSGAAAIHACLLIWRGPAWGELDLFPLLAILSVSCIIMVPLLNWSATIRTAGHPELQRRENKERPAEIREIDASSRAILIFWSFLVTVGFICAFVALQDQTPDGRWGHWSSSVYSGAETFSCAPESGVLNVTAGQPPIQEVNGEMAFNFFVITQEFIDQNNCQSPCSDPVGGTALFRTENDLALLSAYQRFRALGGLSDSAFQAKEQALILDYAYYWSYIVVYVLIEGIWTACFGRNKPSQTRTMLYGFFSRIPLSRKPHINQIGALQRMIAQAIALTAYSWSVFIIVIAIPLLAVNITVLELYISELPQGESSIHIGAWSPWASTALVLFVAAFARSYDTIKAVLIQSGGNAWRLLTPKIVWPGNYKGPVIKHNAYVTAARRIKEVCMAVLDFIFGSLSPEGIKEEWTQLKGFWKDPEESYNEFYYPARELKMCTCPADYICELHQECSHHRICINKTECKDKGCPPCMSTSGHHECICTGPKEHVVTLPVKVIEGLIEPKTATTTQISLTDIHIPLSQSTDSSRDSIPHTTMPLQGGQVPDQVTFLPHRTF